MGKLAPILGLFALLSLSTALPRGQRRFVRSLTDSSEFLKVLTDEIKKIPIEQFENDTLLLQKVDSTNPGNPLTSYLLAVDNSIEVYQRQSNDAGKDVIVLSKDEDHLEFKKLKRRYVVLTKKPGTQSYYVGYAYLRDATPADMNNKVSIDGSTWSIEWDAWDYRGPGKERFATFGFSNCGPSAIVPCGFNSKVSPDKDIKPLSVKQKWMPSSKFLNSPPNIKLTRFGTESGFDINDNFDLYGDLQVTKEGSGRSLTAPSPEMIFLDSDEVNTRGGSGTPAWVGGPSGGFYSARITYSYSVTKEVLIVRGSGKGGSGGGEWKSSGAVISDSSKFAMMGTFGAGGKPAGPMGPGGLKPGSANPANDSAPDESPMQFQGTDEAGGQWKAAFAKETTKIKWENSESFEFGLGSGEDFTANFIPDGQPNVSIPGSILNAPLSSELPTDFQAAQTSDGPKGDTRGKMIPRKPAGSLGFTGWLHYKSETELTITNVRCNASYQWIFKPDVPEKGEAATYYPDSNPEIGQPGIYFGPKPNGNVSGEFKPNNPSDPSMKETNHGKLVLTDTPDKAPIYGQMMPPESPGGNNKFYPDADQTPPKPKGRSFGAKPTINGDDEFAADFQPNDQPNVLIPGSIFNTPLSPELPTDFQAAQPSDGPKSDTRGKMIPRKPAGSLGFTGWLHYKSETELTVTNVRCNASYQWIFKPDVPEKGEAATYYPDSNPEIGQPGIYFGPKPNGNVSGEFKPNNPSDPSMKETNHGKLVLTDTPDKAPIYGQMMPPEPPGGNNKFYPDADQTGKPKDRSFGGKPTINGDDEFAAVFQPNDQPNVLIPGSIFNTPLSPELPTDFQAAQPSDGPKSDTRGKMIPRKPAGSAGIPGMLHYKTEVELTCTTGRCNATYQWVFYPEPQGEPATYYPDNNPEKAQPGIYFAPKSSGDPFGEFKPKDPSDPSMTEKNHGKLVPDTPNKTEIYAVMMPAESIGTNNKFYPDADQTPPKAKGRSFEKSGIEYEFVADFQPDARPDTLIPGYILSQPLSSKLPTDFQADQPNDALKIDTHGKMIPRKPEGSARIPGTLHYKTEPELTATTERSNASYQWIFKPDPPGEPATYYPDSNPEKGQPGTYWVPRPDAEYGEFKPKNPNDPSMNEKNHGRMVLNDSPNDPGTFGDMMWPDNAGENNKFYPDKKIKEKGRSFDGKPSPPATTTPPIVQKGRSFGGKPANNVNVENTDLNGKVAAKGLTIANAKSITGKANAFAVSKTGNGAQANAINGSEATANAMATKQGDSQARAETYGAGGAKSNSLAMGTGVATGTALSRGKGNAQSNAVAAGGAAVSNALAAKGGNSSSNAISNAKGNSLSSSVALGGGVSRSSAIAMGQGIAKSNSLTEGGGNSYAVADARGGGGALSNSLAKQGAASHAISSSKGEGASMSNSVTKGGGNTRAEAMADSGDSIANAVQEDDADDVPFDEDLFTANVPNMPNDNFNLIVPQGEVLKPKNKQKGRSFTGSPSAAPSAADVDPTVYLAGWKMQYSKLFPNASFAHENEVFYGLGSCPHKPIPLTDLDAANSADKLINFYMGYLGSWCLTTESDSILTLIEDGAIVIERKAMTVPSNSKFANQNKLTSRQLEELVMAFELSVFTQQFVEQKNNIPPLESRIPSRVQVTRSVRYLIDFILRGLDLGRQKLRLHFVRLTRQLILVAKVTYAKLLQDFDALDACEDCTEDKRLNHNDRTEVMAVIEFMIKGLSPVDKGESSEAAFEKFFKVNQGAIEIRVSTFAS